MMTVSELTYTIEINANLAQEIIKKYPANQKIKEICNDILFKIDPIYSLFNAMLTTADEDDTETNEACAFIMSQIPYQLNKEESLRCFKKIIEGYEEVYELCGGPTLDKIMEVYHRSIQSEKFQKDLENAIEAYIIAKKETNNFQNAVHYFCQCLTIVDKSGREEEYSYK